MCHDAPLQAPCTYLINTVFLLCPGLFLTSWVPWGFLPGRYGKKRMAMGRIRMGITNSFMLLQAIFLSTFPSDGSMNAMNTISLIVDFAYRIISCVWFLETGFSPLLTFLKKRCNHTEDSNHTAAEADSNIVHETLEDLNQRAEVESHSVEESSPSLNHPAGNALTSHNLFVPYDDSHCECQKLIDSHIGHKHNDLVVNQPFHHNSDLHTHPIPFHDPYDQEVFQLKSSA